MKNFDVVAVTETWLTPNYSSSVVNIPGYIFHRLDRDGRGGGVGFYIRSSFKSQVITVEQGDRTSIEMLWLKIFLGRKSIVVGVVYRPPRGNLDNAVEALDNVLSFLTPIHEDILVLGDFNVNFLTDNKISQCLQCYNLDQLVKEPTRITDHSATLLDPIFFTSIDKCQDVGTLSVETISDHLAVYCNISFVFPKQTPRIVTFRDFKNFDQERFTADLFSINWIDVIYIQNLDDKAKFISDNIIALFDHHAPLKTIRVTKPRAPWLTPNLKLLMKLRDKALHRFRKNPSPANRTHYNDLRNFVVSATVAEKRGYLLHLSQNVGPTGFFKTLKSLKVQESNLTDLPDCLSDPTKINNFFTNVFQNSDASCFEKTEFYSNSRLNKNINFQLKLIDMATLLKIIRGIKSNACGSDGITIEMVRLCLPAIAPYVLHLINSCLEIGYFPQLWKEALILPLPKIPAPRTPSDLRPISILPVLSKVLERAISSQLTEFLEVSAILPSHQSGFRKGHSTTTALARVCDDILRGMDNKQATVLVLLDFSKAFDTLNHKLLIAKCKHIGFDLISLRWLKCYLNDRHQYVTIRSKTSSKKPVCSGVPQGSVLGPLLFLIYTFDLINAIKNCSVQLYADDTQIYHSFNPEEHEYASTLINEDLINICSYADKHNLRLNAAKSTCMIFCSKKKRELLKSLVSIKIHSEALSFSPCVCIWMKT
nr:unnamed protein product [Callosobruchus chinensis]